MRTVGLKLADGSFYPIMEEGSAQKKTLELTTAHDNQTCVMVDLYRSKLCSMEDAEYIDTLKIENLNAHQNGEPSISFDVGLDENGELSASIADPETGATSNSQITLVSRTAEERLVADDYSISGDEPVKEKSGNGAGVAAGVVAGAGLLAAAGMIAANKNKENEDAEVINEEDATLTDDDISEVTENAVLDEFSFDDTPATDTLVDETIPDDTSLEEFSLDNTPSEDTIADEITADEAITEEPAADESFAEEPTPDETIAEDFSEPAADETISDDTLPDMDFDMPEDSSDTISDSNGLVADSGLDDFDLPDDTTQAATDDFDLPEDTTIPGDETILEDETFAAPAELTDDTEEDTFRDQDAGPCRRQGR